MIHSHDHPGNRVNRSYAPFATTPHRKNIDTGAFIVKSHIAKEIRFKHRNYDADGRFLEDLLDSGQVKRIGHMSKAMVVHN